MRLRVWVVVDMAYRPRPIAVEASASRDWCVQYAKERNNHMGNLYYSKRRYRVFTASTEVKIK
jgi:hypothetical protein